MSQRFHDGTKTWPGSPSARPSINLIVKHVFLQGVSHTHQELLHARVPFLQVDSLYCTFLVAKLAEGRVHHSCRSNPCKQSRVSSQLPFKVCCRSEGSACVVVYSCHLPAQLLLNKNRAGWRLIRYCVGGRCPTAPSTRIEEGFPTNQSPASITSLKPQAPLHTK